MSKTIWVLIFLGMMDLIFVIMHYTHYVLLFLKPTGYMIPFVLNIVVIIIIIFKSKLSKDWAIIVTISILFISIPVILFYGLILWLQDYRYTEINNPYKQESLVIEYRHATLGETTYFYHFYKTRFGFLGKHLDDQDIKMMVRHNSTGIDAEGVLGLDNEEWITANTVRFYTSDGMKDVHVSSSKLPSNFNNTEQAIQHFMDKAKNKEDGQSITVNGILLTTRYDSMTDQEWIEVTNKSGEGTILTQQCSRITVNKELGYYTLEECTHRWEYALYPMNRDR